MNTSTCVVLPFHAELLPAGSPGELSRLWGSPHEPLARGLPVSVSLRVKVELSSALKCPGIKDAGHKVGFPPRQHAEPLPSMGTRSPQAGHGTASLLSSPH